MTGMWQFTKSLLLAQPLFWVVVTLLTFCVGVRVSHWSRHNAFANPLLFSVTLIVLLLKSTHTSYAQYLDGARYINFLLGPATVALAIPLYRNLHEIRRSARAVVPAVAAGAIVSAATAVLIARLTAAAPVVTASLIAHSTTTPIALGIAEKVGGNASLTATFTMLTSMASVLLLGSTMKLLGVKDPRVQGLAAGTTGHGLATARMVQLDRGAGAFSGFAMGLNAIVTSLVAPPLAYWLVRLAAG